MGIPMEIPESVTLRVGHTVSGRVNLKAHHRKTNGNRGIGNFGGVTYGIGKGELEGKEYRDR